MSSLWEQRAARNEALFRQVNENIAGLEERYGASQDRPVFVCECADDRCVERVQVEADVYRRVRAQPRWFLVVPGHERLALERVVELHDQYAIVEKTGVAGDIAERTHESA